MSRGGSRVRTQVAEAKPKAARAVMAEEYFILKRELSCQKALIMMMLMQIMVLLFRRSNAESKLRY